MAVFFLCRLVRLALSAPSIPWRCEMQMRGFVALYSTVRYGAVHEVYIGTQELPTRRPSRCASFADLVLLFVASVGSKADFLCVATRTRVLDVFYHPSLVLILSHSHPLPSPLLITSIPRSSSPGSERGPSAVRLTAF